MDCKKARERLWPADALRVSDAEVEAALKHAEACAACDRFLEVDRLTARLIRDHVSRVPAPEALRERLYTALARERTGGLDNRRKGLGGRGQLRRSAPVLSALLLVVVVLGAGGYWLATQDGPALAAAAFAEDYLRRAVEQEELNTGDRREIAAFFARELGMATEPPVLPDYEVQRASICMMNGRRGGVVEYEGDGRQLTYYVIPRGADRPSASSAVDARRVRTDTRAASLAGERGLGVATWSDGEHQHALVANMPARELKSLASRFFGGKGRP